MKTVIKVENDSKSRLPARAANLMFCLTHDDSSIGNEAGVDRGRIGKTCRLQACDRGWDTRVSGGKRASPSQIRRSDASKPASPAESCDGRNLDMNLSGFSRALPKWFVPVRNLIRDSAGGITPGVVVSRHVGVGHG